MHILYGSGCFSSAGLTAKALASTFRFNLGSSWSAELWAYVEEEDGVEFQPMVALCSYSFSAEQVG